MCNSGLVSIGNHVPLSFYVHVSRDLRKCLSSLVNLENHAAAFKSTYTSHIVKCNTERDSRVQSQETRLEKKTVV